MPVVLEEINDIQYITNKSGEKTAIIIPLEESSKDFRRLLTEFIRTNSFNDVESLIKLEKGFNELMALVQSNKSPVILNEIANELANLLEKIDEKIEDEFDLSALAERSDEETVSHEKLKEELKADGVI